MDLIEIGTRLLVKLEQEGYEAYLVGGSVRDYLLDLVITDVDIASSARPDELLAIWPDAIPTGIKYGTVTLIYEGLPIEVTTFREESSYQDFRRPEIVNFGKSLTVDLARRDFTINALAMDIKGEVIDYHGGLDDLKRGLIRAVGDPAERFREDPLRMLRALRLASQLGFTIENRTWQELLAHASYIQYVALERVKQELDRLLAGDHVDQGLELLVQSRLLESIPHALETKLQQAIVNIDQRLLVVFTQPLTRWFILLRDLADSEFAYLLKGLSFSKKDQQELLLLRELEGILRADLSEESLKACLLKYKESSLAEMIALVAGYTVVDSAEESANTAEYWLGRLTAISESLVVRSLADLEVNGNDLVNEFAIDPGRQIGEIMEELLYRVVFRGIANEKRTLLLEAAKIRGEILERLSNS